MLEQGIKGRQEELVTETNSAKEVGSGQLMVYATPAMIALVEKTAWMSVASYLEKGEGTVGTKLDVSHISATPVGMKVWCETKLSEVDKRRLVFSIMVYDEKGKIGEGTHERFVINNEKFISKANSKLE